MEAAELKSAISMLSARVEEIRDWLDLPDKKSQLQKLEEKMSKAGFWDNSDSAQLVVSQLSALKSVIEPVEELEREVKDLQELYELASDTDRDEVAQLAEERKAATGPICCCGCTRGISRAVNINTESLISHQAKRRA
jgi:protein subunit release factor A